MFCRKCGKELSDGQKFCTQCGEAVPERSQLPQQAAALPEDDASQGHAADDESGSHEEPVNPVPEPVQSEADESKKTQSFCTKCGQKLSKGQKFCTKCGEPVPERSQPPQQAAALPEDDAGQEHTADDESGSHEETVNPVPEPVQSETAATEKAETQRVCTKCGQKLSKGQKFCTRCGEPVPECSQPPQQAAAPTEDDAGQEHTADDESGSHEEPVIPVLEPVQSAATALEKAETQRFCTKCGQKLSKEQKFCTKCGAPVPGAEETPQTRETPQGNDAGHPPAPVIEIPIPHTGSDGPKNKTSSAGSKKAGKTGDGKKIPAKIVIIAVAIILLAGVAAGGFFFVRTYTEKNNQLNEQYDVLIQSIQDFDIPSITLNCENLKASWEQVSFWNPSQKEELIGRLNALELESSSAADALSKLEQTLTDWKADMEKYALSDSYGAYESAVQLMEEALESRDISQAESAKENVENAFSELAEQNRAYVEEKLAVYDALDLSHADAEDLKEYGNSYQKIQNLMDSGDYSSIKPLLSSMDEIYSKYKDLESQQAAASSQMEQAEESEETVTPEPEPPAEPSPILQISPDSVKGLVDSQASGAVWAFAVMDTADGEIIGSDRMAETLSSSALLNIPVLYAAAYMNQEGTLDLDTQVRINRATAGRSTLAGQVGQSLTIRELLRYMLQYSDNTASNTLMEYLTFQKINEVCASRGYPSVSLNNYILSTTDYTANDNYVSCQDLCGMLGELYTDTFSGIGSQFLRDNMVIQDSAARSGLGKFVPASITFMNLNGQKADKYNEVAILDDNAGHAYVLAFMGSQKSLERLTAAAQSCGQYIYGVLGL